MRAANLIFGVGLLAVASGAVLVFFRDEVGGIAAKLAGGVPPFAALASGGKVPLADAVRQMAVAIVRQETSYRGTIFPPIASQMAGRAPKNNNPGNLRMIGQRGTVGEDPQGFAVFGSMSAGWDALLRDVKAKLTGNTRTALNSDSTLAEFVGVYAPRTENDTGGYIANLARWLGLSPNFRFSDWVDFS